MRPLQECSESSSCRFIRNTHFHLLHSCLLFMFLLHGETFEGLKPTDHSWIFKCEFSRQLLQGQVGFKSTPHAVFFGFGPIKVHIWRKTWGAAEERLMSLLLKNEANTETTKGADSLMSTWGSSSESRISMSSIRAEIKRFTACCKNQLQPLWIVSSFLTNLQGFAFL